MRRREFIIRVAALSAAWPLMAHAQHRPVVGVIRIAQRGASQHLEDAFRRGLNDGGYVESQNVLIEWRWANGYYDGLPGIVTELVSRRVTVLAAMGATATALTAKAATETIPIVFMIGGDPVEFGLVKSLAHPGGNITGVALLAENRDSKRVELLHQLVPAATRIALLINPANPYGQVGAREVEAAARSLGLELHVINVRHQGEIDAIFPDLIAQGISAIMIGADAFFLNQRSQIASLAARYAIPALAEQREYPEAGGLASYGPNTIDAYRLTGLYVARILKGEKPADMPVQQATKFELVINIKTAKALGINVPETMLTLADQVLE